MNLRREGSGRIKVIRDIELSFIHPPIPDRNCDWQASRKDYEPGDPLGHGRTPVVALTDLLEQEEDVWERPSD